MHPHHHHHHEHYVPPPQVYYPPGHVHHQPEVHVQTHHGHVDVYVPPQHVHVEPHHHNNQPQPYQPPQAQQPTGNALPRFDPNDFRAAPPKFGSQYGPPPFHGGYPPSNQWNKQL